VISKLDERYRKKVDPSSKYSGGDITNIESNLLNLRDNLFSN